MKSLVKIFDKNDPLTVRWVVVEHAREHDHMIYQPVNEFIQSLTANREWDWLVEGDLHSEVVVDASVSVIPITYSFITEFEGSYNAYIIKALSIRDAVRQLHHDLWAEGSPRSPIEDTMKTMHAVDADHFWLFTFAGNVKLTAHRIS